MRHPKAVLFAGEKPFPVLPAVDHYAGSEKLMKKALLLQKELGPIFDITCDCEDGAHAGAEREHAEMAASVIMSDDNLFNRVGARVHDVTHPHWRQDMEILVGRAASRLPFITLPKPCSAGDVQVQIEALREIEQDFGVDRGIPVHVLIETHGALREVWEIAALSGVESLDFGLMDFVSGHHGAIPGSAMRSPGQFDHPLIARAKCEITAAALANGVVPSHNVTTELKDIDMIRNDARRARTEFGYLRMWSIHPNQIVPIVEAMRPDFSEVQAATEILIAAQESDWGPIQHAGKLHDRASYRYYWELLDRAHVTGMEIPPAARERFLPEFGVDRSSEASLAILHRDEHIVVIDKPPNLLVHRSEIDRHETRFAIQLLRDQIGRRVWPAHRLDRGTSGVLLFALSAELAGVLGRQFEAGTVEKRYWAVVRGHPPAEGLIDHPLSRQRDAYEFQGDRCSQEAQAAVTRFRCLATTELPVMVDRYPSSRYALIELEPVTGRRHQLRRHLKHIAHPIIGDATYGKGRHNRFFAERFGCHRSLLACIELAFDHPVSGQRLRIKAPVSGEFAATLAQFGWNFPQI